MGKPGERYAVAFRELDGPVVAGSLEFDEERLALRGRSPERKVELDLRLTEIVDVHIGRHASERLNGYPTLVLEREGMPPLQVAPLGAGFLHEIADLVITLTATAGERVDELAVTVPLKPGCREKARELLALGPPLDPASLGLTCHRVYLREDEAVFVFAGPDVRARVRRAARSPALWRAGVAWRDCIADQPRIEATVPSFLAGLAPAYSWEAARAATNQ